MLRVQHAEDSQRRPNQQPYFNGWAAAWDRELETTPSGRFDDSDPMPTKTIRSVVSSS